MKNKILGILVIAGFLYFSYMVLSNKDSDPRVINHNDCTSHLRAITNAVLNFKEEFGYYPKGKSAAMFLKELFSKPDYEASNYSFVYCPLVKRDLNIYEVKEFTTTDYLVRDFEKYPVETLDPIYTPIIADKKDNHKNLESGINVAFLNGDVRYIELDNPKHKRYKFSFDAQGNLNWEENGEIKEALLIR